MGLACSNIRLLTLTRLKADVEFKMSMNSVKKMALMRASSELSSEYNRRLQAKKICYYDNNSYHKMDYQYLMGYGNNYFALSNGSALKENRSMVLTDNRGQVVLSSCYANAIKAVLGNDIMDVHGRGSTFSLDKIPEILAELIPGNEHFTAEDFEKVINDEILDYEYNAYSWNVLSGEVGDTTQHNASQTKTDKLKNIVSFYYPIFAAAAANGWTTEYEQGIETNSDYITDALVTGTFQLNNVTTNGEYQEGTTLGYYVNTDKISERTDSSVREEITAWYNAERSNLEEKENYLDCDMSNLSARLEAYKAEIQSVKSLIDDAVSSVFNWPGNK